MPPSFDTPILFIVFNRLDVTKLVFDEIRKFAPPKLYVAADGFRSDKEGEKEKCDMVRQLVSNVDWDCEVKYLFQDKNLWCKIWVSTAISWLFEHEEYWIILEDDCKPAKWFFEFCDVLLKKYLNNKKLMMICWTNFMDKWDVWNSYFFTQRWSVWWWATWKRAWDLYYLDILDFDAKVTRKRLMDIYHDLDLANDCVNLYKNAIDSKIDTWDYQWSYTIVNNGGCSIVPSENLISNIWFGEDATHTCLVDSAKANLKNHVFNMNDLKHPDEIKIDTNYELTVFRKLRKFSVVNYLNLKNMWYIIKNPQKLFKKLKKILEM